MPKCFLAEFSASITMNQPLGKVGAFYLSHLAGVFIFLSAVHSGNFGSTPLPGATGSLVLSELASTSAPSENLSLMDTYVVLDFFFLNAAVIGNRCASGALAQDWCVLPNCGHTNRWLGVVPHYLEN